MAKLAITLLALLAFQSADFASVHSNDDFEQYLRDIKTEIFNLSLYLEKSFPDNHHAISTVTWQCHRVAEAIQIIINKLSEESLNHHENGEKVFKQIWFTLQEIHTSLQQIALSTDVTDVSEIKKQLVLNLQLVSETLEKMIHVTYIYYPQFRMSLKQMLNDFLIEISKIHQSFSTERNDVTLRTNPKQLSKDITKLTQSILFYWNKVSFENLEWFYQRVHEILYNLEMKEKTGDEEVDVVLKILAMKFRKIVYNEGKFANYLPEVAMLFEQIVFFVEKGTQDGVADRFVQKIVYDYSILLNDLSQRIRSRPDIMMYEPDYTNFKISH